ncbi:MAG: carboxylating nicotinate-nucleotide diphosphorylase [Planctomycetota bacterium]
MPTRRKPAAWLDRAGLRRFLRAALAEDVGRGDITSRGLFKPDDRAAGRFICRAGGVIAGLPVVAELYRLVDRRVRFVTRVRDGALVAPGTVIATAAGPVRALLTAERLALNILQHLSGIATVTRRFVRAAAGTRAAIVDTRKTVPGMRLLAKYAVRAGGGKNHRMGLYDQFLVKDNHADLLARAGRRLDLAGLRSRAPKGTILAVEARTRAEVTAYLPARPDIILLDNMPPARVAALAAFIRREAPGTLIEASGGITLANVRAYAVAGADRISIGALTHSAPALDIAFDA